MEAREVLLVLHPCVLVDEYLTVALVVVDSEEELKLPNAKYEAIPPPTMIRAITNMINVVEIAESLVFWLHRSSITNHS